MTGGTVLIAGGSPDSWPDLALLGSDVAIWIGVDRGAFYALEQGLPISVAVGDFDSLNRTELAYLEKRIPEIHYSQAEKDDTDTQLALLTALEKAPAGDITLIGATGGRLDHFLSNLWLPLEERFAPVRERLVMRDMQNSIRYYSPGRYRITQEPGMTYLAFVCLTPVTKLSIHQAKYRLSEKDFVRPTSLASNEFVGGSSDFSFESGVVAVIQSRDKEKRS